MAVNPAQVQSVNTSYDIPQDNPFLTMLQAGAQGYFDKMNEPKKQFASAFPTMAQMKMLDPAEQGTPGALPFAGSYWKPKSPGVDLSDLNTISLINQREREKGLTFPNAFNALVNSPYGMEMLDKSPEEIVQKVSSVIDYFNKVRGQQGQQSDVIKKVKKATKPINGNPISVDYQGQTVYLGEDGMYYTAQELGE